MLHSPVFSHTASSFFSGSEDFFGLLKNRSQLIPRTANAAVPRTAYLSHPFFFFSGGDGSFSSDTFVFFETLPGVSFEMTALLGIGVIVGEHPAVSLWIMETSFSDFSGAFRPRAETKSETLPNRCSGSFSVAFLMASLTLSGADSGSLSALREAWISVAQISPRVLPSLTAFPDKISATIRAKAYWSVRGEIFPPSTCSGAM